VTNTKMLKNSINYHVCRIWMIQLTLIQVRSTPQMGDFVWRLVLRSPDELNIDVVDYPLHTNLYFN